MTAIKSEQELQQMAKVLQKLPESTQFAICRCLPNLPYGANWGICETEDVKERLEFLRKDRNLFVLPVVNGCVLQVARGYLETACNSTLGDLVKQKDIVYMNEMAKKAEVALRKFIESKKKKGGYSGMLGIYCTNITSNIRYKDVDYPAFRMDLQSALTVLQQYGCGVVIEGELQQPANVLSLITSNPKSVSKSLIMSPTKTGVFIKVCIK